MVAQVMMLGWAIMIMYLRFSWDSRFGTIPANQVSSGFSGLISYDRTWEKVSQKKNFGIDLSNFFDNRLKATFDYFIKIIPVCW